MALELGRLFLNKNYDYGISSLKFDLILSETHTLSNTISEHNVEDGSVISDHIKNNLQAGSLVGFISNFSIQNYYLNRDRSAFRNKAKDAFELINEIWRRKDLVKIIVMMKVYNNVAIENIDMNFSEGDGEAISMNVSFKEMNVVTLKTVDLGNVKPGAMTSDKARQASDKKDLGRQTPVLEK